MLAPGRLTLATRPNPTGSPPTVKTMGIVVVAALTANTTGAPPPETITLTCRGPDRAPVPAVGRTDLPPNGIRPPHSGLRHSPIPSDPRGTPRSAGVTVRAMRH